MEEQVSNLTKELREYSENMSTRLKDGIRLDEIEGVHRNAIYDKLYEEGKIVDIAKVTPEEEKLVDEELDAIKNTEVLKEVREVSGEFFKKEQQTIEAMQKELEVLKEEAKKEAEKVEQDIKALEDKQKAHEEDPENPELTEDEQKTLAELNKKREYFKTKFPEQLKVMGQRMAHARETISYQKEALNVTCQERFGGFAVRNEKKKEEQEKEKPGQGERITDEREGGQGDIPPAEGPGNNNQRQQQGGNQRQQGNGGGVGGGAPVQQGQQQGQQQAGQAQEQVEEEHVPTEAEILGETEPVLKYDGREMTAKQALEYMRQYSTFTPEERKKCLRNGGLEVIKKATATLSVKGGELTQGEKNLLSTYSETISASTMEMAKVVAEESKKPDGRNPLSLVLKMKSSDKKFKEIQKYFDHNTGWKFWEKKPQVIFDYNSIPKETRALFDKAIEDFKKSQEDAAKEIEDMQTKLKDPSITAEEKKNLKETISLATERMNDDSKGFEKVFGSVVRTGKALAFTKEIEKMAEKVQNMERQQHTHEDEEEHDFEEELSEQTLDDEEVLDNRELKIKEEFDKEREAFAEAIQAKIDAGEEITFEEYAKYNQYIAYGVSENDLPDIDEATIPEVVVQRTRVDGILDKTNAIDEAIANGHEVTDDMLLTEEEMHIMIGMGQINPSGPRMEKYCSEATRDSYKDNYDLKVQAEKKVQEMEEADRSTGREDPDEPVV